MHPRTQEIFDYLELQRTALSIAFRAVPAALRDATPAPGRWSAAGIAEHLAKVESRMADRLSKRIAEARADGLAAEMSTDPILPSLPLGQLLDRSVRLPATEANLPTGLDATAAWEALHVAGTGVRDLLKASDGLALGTVFIPHPRFGSMSVYYFFAFVGAHEARHAAQLHEIVQFFETGK